MIVFELGGGGSWGSKRCAAGLCVNSKPGPTGIFLTAPRAICLIDIKGIINLPFNAEVKSFKFVFFRATNHNHCLTWRAVQLWRALVYVETFLFNWWCLRKGLFIHRNALRKLPKSKPISKVIVLEHSVLQMCSCLEIYKTQRARRASSIFNYNNQFLIQWSCTE